MTHLTTQKYWKIKNPNPSVQKIFSDQLGIHPIIAQVLINRGILEPQEAFVFLNSDLKALHDPFLLKDMNKAVDRIRQAGMKKESILIFGDYDVDGVTSSALLHKTLKVLGVEVFHHIPHRLHDGYGLSDNILERAKEKGMKLLIAVDCGITALKEVEILNQAGIDVIIIDHHELSKEGLPQAVAVVNPKRKDCPYPFKDLSSVGLVAKLNQALLGKIPEEDLDLITLGTIADVVPLREENRIFVKQGLRQISQTKNKGLSALIEVAKIKGKEFRPYYVGFILGPRINATGRMDSAHKSLDLLLCQDDEQAYQLARFLEELNAKRQRMEKLVVKEALDLIENEVNFQEEKVIVLSKEGWHKGVLGIVASRIAEMFYRPTIIVSLKEGIGTASARSIEGFHLYQALTHCSQTLENFGGHRLAAGLTIRQENIASFKQLINEFAKGILQIRDLIPTIDIDGEIPLSSLSLELVKNMDLLEPFGKGNPQPVFCSRHLMIKSQPTIVGKDTIKFWVTDGEITLPAVGFGMGRYLEYLSVGKKIDLVYQATIDDWNKEPTIQLKIKDLKEG